MKKDRMGNPYLTSFYFELTSEEKLAHFENVGKNLLKHKYYYYHKEESLSSISDAEYDYVEKYYEAIAEDLDLEPEIVNMVGFNFEHRWSKEIVEADMSQKSENVDIS